MGRLPYKLFLLKEAYDPRKFPHGVYFTLNGQVHGDLPANFISTTLKFDYLGKTLLVCGLTLRQPGLNRLPLDR